jgi:hypothetical protein
LGAFQSCCIALFIGTAEYRDLGFFPYLCIDYEHIGAVFKLLLYIILLNSNLFLACFGVLLGGKLSKSFISNEATRVHGLPTAIQEECHEDVSYFVSQALMVGEPVANDPPPCKVF